MKVIIAGSRSIVDFSAVANAAEKSTWKTDITEVVSGHARGVDRLGEQWARQNNLPIKVFKADWGKFGQRAGYLRNAQMADYADALIAIWDGKSSGTSDMVRQMQQRNKFVYIVIK